MKLTLRIKLLPTEIQSTSLTNTLKEANSACNEISTVAWEKKTFNQFKLHKVVYHQFRLRNHLSAQMAVRCISKVADAYKTHNPPDKSGSGKRTFRLLGGITYDSRILSYNIQERTVSIWTIDGRIKHLSFVCHNEKFLPYIKGEADLITRNGKWYLFQTVEIPEEEVRDVEDFIGVDFGLVNIATLSSGEKMSGKELETYRIKRQKVRSSLQAKGTKNSKRVLKRLSGKEKRTASIVNHTIAKKIVAIARQEGKGIALENLKGIRKSVNNKGKVFRSRVGRWSFSDLRLKIEYKARLVGVPIILVEPRYTSRMCSCCFHVGFRNGESFHCKHCGYAGHADVNAARNIRSACGMGLSIDQPETSALFCQM
jgi:IS605 OrfB family transposase